MRKITFLSFSILLFSNFLLAQGGLYEVPLDEQVNNSQLIVEGKVISTESFWDEDYKLIYTLNTIEVSKSFKGQSKPIIEVVTLGGVVGDTGLSVTHHLELSKNETGVFLLNDSNVQLIGSETDNPKYKVYSSAQGFYRYDNVTNKVSNVFETYGDIEDEFYEAVESMTKKKFTEIKKTSKFSLVKESNSSLAIPFVSNFSPSTVTAGTGNTITINGFNFGATQGTVQFTNADEVSGFVDALSSEITNWTNTSITVKVPHRAGTGVVRVRNDDGFSDTGQLTIPFAIQNRNGLMMQHYDTDTNGGYTWQMSVEFFNSTAKAPFLRAFNNVVCSTGINWVLSPTNTSGGGFFRDGINVIAFDPPGDEFAAGVLGAALNWTTSCATGVVVDEIDFVFDNERSNWNYGPGSTPGSQIDFETVALHELGHGHGFGHVKTNGDLMFRSVGNGVDNRTFGVENINGGNFINIESSTNAQCGKTLMSTITCPSLGLDELALNESVNLYPNPTNGVFYITNNLSINLQKIVVFDVSGRLVSEKNYANTQSNATKVINLEAMSKGVYFVNIHSDVAKITRKLVLD